ncbi:MAG: C10 family peptidase [Bacteroidales bacterium]|nr:C10 family peptidase [Bacteroidales bacterium]
MKKITFLSMLVALCFSTMAATIDVQTARMAGTHHLQRQGMIKADDTLSLAMTKQYTDQQHTITTFYVFNHKDQGFVIVSADDRCTPILGYSMNGSFVEKLMPTNMLGWLDQYSNEIAQGILNDSPANESALKQWAEETAPVDVIPEAPKSNDYLVSSTWEQGYGYNKYCPIYQGQHVVVGCVATAMAQIIRYYGYPTKGFGRKSYSHNYYGLLGVDFDTSEYDYSLMPDHVNYWSGNDVIDMVSRLCYHCGVAVNMEYENPNHTSGSGAHTSRVPEALMHFGYTDAEHYVRNNVNDDARWTAMIRNEIDHQRPIEYSGFGDGGGHAFVLDGYNNREQYHFNWGWGGYGDGFYTLTTMQGFVNTHEMVINIHPSGWDGHATRFYVSPDGNGNGTSWDEANSNLAAAVAINSITQRDIWMKEGTYYGNTTDEYAYRFTAPAVITGGFAGTETTLNDRNPDLHPTIIDGQNSRALLYANARTSSSRALKITDITFTNGYTNTGDCLNLRNDVVANHLTIKNCQSDSGRIMTISDCLFRASTIQNNAAPTIINNSDAAIRQSLISNNDAQVVVNMEGSSARVVNTDIVSNSGCGVVFNNGRSSFVNNIVWNNDTNLINLANLNDTSIRNCAIESDTDFADTTWVRLSSNNDMVRFVNPGTRGLAGWSEDNDWHLAPNSVCIDRGERLCTTDGDLDRNLRSRNGVVDLGCYETNYPVGINNVEQTSVSIHPNPAITTIAIEGLDVNDAMIYDISGRAVMQLNGNRADVSTLPAGVYYLRCQGQATKFVKQ